VPLVVLTGPLTGCGRLILKHERNGVGGRHRDGINRFGWVCLGRRFATAGQRGISEREMTSDFDALVIILVEGAGTRISSAAAEIFAVVGHDPMPTVKR